MRPIIAITETHPRFQISPTPLTGTHRPSNPLNHSAHLARDSMCGKHVYCISSHHLPLEVVVFWAPSHRFNHLGTRRWFNRLSTHFENTRTRARRSLVKSTILPWRFFLSGTPRHVKVIDDMDNRERQRIINKFSPSLDGNRNLHVVQAMDDLSTLHSVTKCISQTFEPPISER